MTNKQKQKLIKLCEHWASHNDSHVENFKKWHKIAEEMEYNAVADDLKEAIAAMNLSTKHLVSAKLKLEAEK